MKKILVLALTALLAVSAFALAAFAAEEPTMTSDVVAYVGFNVGNNEYSGLTPDEAKKQLLTFEDNGVVSLLKDGGTMVAVGKLFIGGDYTLPEMGSTLKITSHDGTTDFKNLVPIDNPYCAMKMAKGATLTLTSDVILDDIIVFQEHDVVTTISVTNNSTLLVGEKIMSLGSMLSAEPMYMAIHVEAGSTAIVKSGTWQHITGEGEIIIADGVTVIEGGETPVEIEAPAETETPVETTAAPVAGTEAPAETGEVPAETTVAPVETTVAPETTAAPVETTEAPAETEAPVTTTAAPAETTAPAGSTEEDGAPIGLIIGIAAAVVVLAAIIVVVAKKKK